MIHCELEALQYLIYKGGEQEDKEQTGEPMKRSYKYTVPVLWNYNNKALKYYDISDNGLLHLKVKLKIVVKISML